MDDDNKTLQGCVELNVKQNTDEWQNARKGFLGVQIGGSGIGAAAGVNLHCKRSTYFSNHLWGEPEEKDKKEKERKEAAFRHGHLCEPYNATLYTEWTGNQVRECGIHIPVPAHNPYFQEKDDLYFAVSCDRIGPQIDLECKCPVSARSFKQYYEDRIDLSYLAQVHLQMAVRQRDCIHFMVTLYEQKPNNTYLLRKAILYEIEFSQDFWQFIYRRARDLAELMWLVSSGEMLPSEIDKDQLDLDTEIGDIPAVNYRVIRRL